MPTKRMWKVPWHLLPPRSKTDREKALEVLKEMRRTNIPLNRVALPRGLTERTVLNNIQGALKRASNTWIARPSDTISRGLNIIENGAIRSIEVNDSKEASKAGKYRFAVGRFIDTGETSYLDKFRDVRIRDSNGVEHAFETDPNQVMEALKRRKTGPYEVYE